MTTLVAVRKGGRLSLLVFLIVAGTIPFVVVVDAACQTTTLVSDITLTFGPTRAYSCPGLLTWPTTSVTNVTLVFEAGAGYFGSGGSIAITPTSGTLVGLHIEVQGVSWNIGSTESPFFTGAGLSDVTFSNSTTLFKNSQIASAVSNVLLGGTGLMRFADSTLRMDSTTLTITTSTSSYGLWIKNSQNLSLEMWSSSIESTSSTQWSKGAEIDACTDCRVLLNDGSTIRAIKTQGTWATVALRLVSSPRIIVELHHDSLIEASTTTSTNDAQAIASNSCIDKRIFLNGSTLRVTAGNTIAVRALDIFSSPNTTVEVRNNSRIESTSAGPDTRGIRVRTSDDFILRVSQSTIQATTTQAAGQSFGLSFSSRVAITSITNSSVTATSTLGGAGKEIAIQYVDDVSIGSVDLVEARFFGGTGLSSMLHANIIASAVGSIKSVCSTWNSHPVDLWALNLNVSPSLVLHSPVCTFTATETESKSETASLQATPTAEVTATAVIHNQDGSSYSADSAYLPRPLKGNVVFQGFDDWASASIIKYTNMTYYGGVMVGDYLWMVPSSRTAEPTKMHKHTGVMTKYGTWPGYSVGNDYNFIGGVYDGTHVWMIPFECTNLIKLDPTDGTMTGYAHSKGSEAFWGGTYDNLGFIWMTPSRANAIVRVDITSGAQVSHNSWPSGFAWSIDALFGAAFDGTHHWCFPKDKMWVVGIDVSSGTMKGWNGALWPAAVVDGSGNRWAGGTPTTVANQIFLTPCAAGSVVELDTSTGVGVAHNGWPASLTQGPCGFFGAIFDGAYIWMAPRTADKMIRFEVSSGGMAAYDNFPSNFVATNSQFHGAAFDWTTSSIYFFPYKANMVVRFTTVTSTLTETNVDQATPTRVPRTKFYRAFDNGVGLTQGSASLKCQNNHQSTGGAPRGYLAVIRNAVEQQWLEEDIAAQGASGKWPNGNFDGAFGAGSDIAKEGEWFWKYGPPEDEGVMFWQGGNTGTCTQSSHICNWKSPTEPNNNVILGGEDVMIFNSDVPHTWNDATGSFSWYVCQFDVVPSTTTTETVAASHSVTATLLPVPAGAASSSFVAAASSASSAASPSTLNSGGSSNSSLLLGSESSSSSDSRRSSNNHEGSTSSSSQFSSGVQAESSSKPQHGSSAPSSASSHSSNKVSSSTGASSRLLASSSEESQAPSSSSIKPGSSSARPPVEGSSSSSGPQSPSGTSQPASSSSCTPFGPSIRQHSTDFLPTTAGGIQESIEVLSDNDDGDGGILLTQVSSSSSNDTTTPSRLLLRGPSFDNLRFRKIGSLVLRVALNLPLRNDTTDHGLRLEEISGSNILEYDPTRARNISSFSYSLESHQQQITITIPYVNPKDGSLETDPRVFFLFIPRTEFVCHEQWIHKTQLPVGFNFSIQVAKGRASIIDPEIQAVVDDFTVSTSVIAAVMAHPSHGMQQLKTTSLLMLAACSYSHSEALPRTVSPFGLKFGKEHCQYYRGAVVGNIICGFVGVIAFFGLIAGVNFVIKRRRGVKIEYSDGTRLGDFKGALAAIHAPSVIVVPTVLGYQGTVSASTSLFIHSHSDEPIDIALAVFGGLVCFSILAFVAVSVTKLFKLKLEKRDNSALEQNNASSASSQGGVGNLRQNEEGMSLWARINSSLQHWVDPHPETQWKQKYHLFFYDYQVEWFFLLELSLGFVLGIIDGIRIGQQGVCIALASIIVALFAGILLLAIILKPSFTSFQQTFLVVLNTLCFVAAVLLLVGLLLREDSAHQATAVVGFIVNILGFLKFLLDLANGILWMRRTNYFAKKKTQFSRTFILTEEEKTGLDGVVQRATDPSDLAEPLNAGRAAENGGDSRGILIPPERRTSDTSLSRPKQSERLDTPLIPAANDGHFGEPATEMQNISAAPAEPQTATTIVLTYAPSAPAATKTTTETATMEAPTAGGGGAKQETSEEYDDVRSEDEAEDLSAWMSPATSDTAPLVKKAAIILSHRNPIVHAYGGGGGAFGGGGNTVTPGGLLTSNFQPSAANREVTEEEEDLL